jgi:drug/metabolite transporter (DMT)-like permease
MKLRRNELQADVRQDMQCVADCETTQPKLFEQPVLQTLQMFVGEAACWLVILLNLVFQRLRSKSTTARGDAYQSVATEDTEEEERGLLNEDGSQPDNPSASQTVVDPTNIVAKALTDADHAAVERQPLTGKKILLLAGPAICDILGTTLMNVGLLFLAASIYQMLRGTCILFVGLFSVLFLKRHLSGMKWASLFVVVTGVAIVGLAGALGSKSHGPDYPGEADGTEGLDLVSRAAIFIRSDVFVTEAHTAAQTVLGLFLIAAAQVLAAAQFVLEESIMERYSMEPIQVVGWEGVFGFSITLIGMGILHAAIGQTPGGRGGYFDAREGFYQMFHYRSIGISSILIMISIG